MSEPRITKREILVALIEAAEAGDIEINDERVTLDDIIDYANITIEQIDHKNAKAKERAAQKRAKTDVIRAAVKAVITNELQSCDEILAKINIEGEEVTRAKLISRLTDLIKSKEITKERRDKIMCYRLRDNI